MSIYGNKVYHIFRYWKPQLCLQMSHKTQRTLSSVHLKGACNIPKRKNIIYNQTNLNSNIATSKRSLPIWIHIQRKNYSSENFNSIQTSVKFLADVYHNDRFSFEIKHLMRKQLELILSKGALTKDIYKYKFIVPKKVKEEVVAFYSKNDRFPNIQERMLLAKKYKVHPRTLYETIFRMKSLRRVDDKLTRQIVAFIEQNKNIGISGKKLQIFKRNVKCNGLQLRLEIRKLLFLSPELKRNIDEWLHTHLYLPPNEVDEAILAADWQTNPLKIRYYFMYKFRSICKKLPMEKLEKIDTFLWNLSLNIPSFHDVEKFAEELHVPYPQLCYNLLWRRTELLHANKQYGDRDEALRLVNLFLSKNYVTSRSWSRLLIISLKTGVLYRIVAGLSYSIRHPPGVITPESKTILDDYIKIYGNEKINYKYLCEKTKLNRFQIFSYISSKMRGEYTPEVKEILDRYAKNYDTLTTKQRKEIARATRLSIKQVSQQLLLKHIESEYREITPELIELIKKWGEKFEYAPPEQELLVFCKEHQLHRTPVNRIIYEERNRYLSSAAQFPDEVLQAAYNLACKIGRSNTSIHTQELLEVCSKFGSEIAMNKAIAAILIRKMKKKIIKEIEILVKQWYENQTSMTRPNAEEIEKWIALYPGWEKELERNINKMKRNRYYSLEERKKMETLFKSYGGVLPKSKIYTLAEDFGRTPISVESWFRKKYKGKLSIDSNL